MLKFYKLMLENTDDLGRIIVSTICFVELFLQLKVLIPRADPRDGQNFGRSQGKFSAFLCHFHVNTLILGRNHIQRFFPRGTS